MIRALRRLWCRARGHGAMYGPLCLRCLAWTTESEWQPGELGDDDDDCVLCRAGTIHLADMCEPHDRTDQYTYDPDRSLADIVSEQPIQQAPPPMNEPLTVEGMVRVMRRIRDSEPRAIASPATASQIRQAAYAAGQQVDVIVSEHVPDGQAYVFRPPPLDGGRP